MTIRVKMTICLIPASGVLKDAILVAGVLHGLAGLGLGAWHVVVVTHVAGPSRGRQVLEHGLRVLRQHVGQVARHRVRPEEVVVQRRVRVISGTDRRQTFSQMIYRVVGTVVSHHH